MRKTALNCVYELAKINPNVVFIGSDLGPGVLNEMKDEILGRSDSSFPSGALACIAACRSERVTSASAGSHLTRDAQRTVDHLTKPFFNIYTDAENANCRTQDHLPE